MKNVYVPGSFKSGPVVRRVEEVIARNVVLSESKATKWKKPCSKKTCADLLYQADAKPGMLTAEQRSIIEARAGKTYVKKDPFLQRPDENQAEYIRRINKLVG